MNTGVEILLQRMKDNPEDFDYSPHNGGMSRWSRIVDHALSAGILTTEEIDAIKLAQLEASRERFTELVMKELAGEGEVSDEGKRRMSTSPQSVMGLGGATQGGYTLTSNGNGQIAWVAPTTSTSLTSNSLTIGNTTIQEQHLQKLLEAQMEAGKRKVEEAEKKQTLFGKLFNYT